MNTYFQYKSAVELLNKYKEVFEKIEEQEGELDEETSEVLYQIETDLELLCWEVLQLIETLDADIKLNKKRSDNISKKNKSLENQIEFLEKFASDIIKKKGMNNGSGNKNLKLGERSLTVVTTTTNKVEDDFNDKRFIKYNLNKIPSEHLERISNFLKQREVEFTSEKIILKKELNAALKEGVVVEGVIEEKKEHLTIK